MCKGLSEVSIADKYKVMSVDELPQVAAYSKYRIRGAEYDPVTIYDMPNCIAINDTSQSFVGEEVLFV